MSNPFSLTDKTILVTGASSGIGKQVAVSCSEMGATVIITGRNKARLAETFGLLKSGNNHIQGACDLTNERERDAFLDSLPALDGLVHCAGIVMPTPAKFIAAKHIRQMMEINFESAVLMISRLFKGKKLNKHCSLVFLSSVGARYPYNGGGLYNVSKAAIEAYSRNLALEMQGMGLRSNCIVAAMVETPIYEETMRNTPLTKEQYARKYPLGIGKPEDVANAAIFLLSPASRWITGTGLILDGGYTLTIL